MANSIIKKTTQYSDYTIYNSVTDLGLTSGSATILATFNAMVANTILICSAGEFASAEVPAAQGAVEIVKPSNPSRSYLVYRSKSLDTGDYRMFLGSTNYNGNNDDLPSGAWLPELTALIGNRESNANGKIGTALTINFPNTSTHLLAVGADSATRNYVGLVFVNSSGQVIASDIFKGSNVTTSTATRALTLTFNNSSDCSFVCIPLRGKKYTGSSIS